MRGAGGRKRTPLAAILAKRIRDRGPITFAEYMAECLYHPQHGYYSRAERTHFADYYTSVDVHPVFGRLLARQLQEMWLLLGQPRDFQLVEAGAGRGALARHILDCATQSFPRFYDALRYSAVERSAARRAAHSETLGPHLAAGRAESLAELPVEIPVGCIFSNELLDALPVHRVVQEGDELREIFVDLDGDGLIERRGALSTAEIAQYFQAQNVTLREGQQAEAGLEACRWIAAAGRSLGAGFVLTIDYGHEARQLYDERHLRGTVLVYQKYRATEDFYRAPGEQDLTAHVSFAALDIAGRAVGLARTGLVSQTRFLLALAQASEFADISAPDQSERERLEARLAFKTLIHPEGMGETFQVLVQHKGLGAPRLAGLQPF